MPNWLRKLLGIERFEPHVVADIVRDFEGVKTRLIDAAIHHNGQATAANDQASAWHGKADAHAAEAARATAVADNITRLITA